MMYRGVLIAERANGTFDIILPHRWLNRPYPARSQVVGEYLSVPSWRTT